jgi:hypothetical protein
MPVAGVRRPSPTGKVVALISTERVLVVDGANVVGSRPDGWWRDRAGAARRLHEQLVAADLEVDRVVLVVEGAARSGVPEGRDGTVVTRHAAGSGDDELVAVCEENPDDDVTLVSADRELRARVTEVGAECVGPRWLLDRL